MTARSGACLVAALASLGIADARASDGAPSPEIHADVVGGAAFDEQELSSAVAILVDAERTPTSGRAVPVRDLHCGGVAVARDVVLTAAHCVDDEGEESGGVLHPTYYVVRDANLIPWLEDPARRIPSSAVRASATRVHPDFDRSAMARAGLGAAHDLALLILEDEIDVATAAYRPSSSPPAMSVGTAVDVVGWGQRDDSYQSRGLRALATSVIREVGAVELRIGGVDEPRRCLFDSGGPTYEHDAPAGVEHVVGIGSRSYGPSRCADASVDVRVDVHSDWIDEALREACDSGLRPSCRSTSNGGCRTPPTVSAPVRGVDVVVVLAISFVLRRRRAVRRRRSATSPEGSGRPSRCRAPLCRRRSS